MRIEGSVTAISWIPSEAIEGMPKLPFELGVGHYDDPPPDRISRGDLERLRDADRFREANELKAWIEVEDGAIVGLGYQGGGLVGSTTFRLGPKAIVVPGVPFEVLRADPEVSGDRVRFVQTVGGRAGFPAPRLVKGGPPGWSRAGRFSGSSRPRRGRRSHSRCTPTAASSTSWSVRARSRVIGST